MVAVDRSDARLAADAATAAGRLLMDLRRSSSARGAALGEEGDLRSDRFLQDLLRDARPGDVVLSEETADDPRRLAAERVWIVDPLDGTREYGEPPRDDWAVHVALWQRGALVAGAVALPARGATVSTYDPPLCPPPPSGGPLRIAVSRSRPPAVATALGSKLGAVLAPMGSAGVKVAAVLTGDVAAYVHAGGQYEWDSAGPVAVARAAGLHASRVNGDPLAYNQPDPSLPDVVVLHPEVAHDVLTAIGQLIEELEECA